VSEENIVEIVRVIAVVVVIFGFGWWIKIMCKD